MSIRTRRQHTAYVTEFFVWLALATSPTVIAPSDPFRGMCQEVVEMTMFLARSQNHRFMIRNAAFGQVNIGWAGIATNPGAWISLPLGIQPALPGPVVE